MWGGIVQMEQLANPDDLFPSTKCYPLLMKHQVISISVDYHTMLIIVLEPEYSNDAMFGNGNPDIAV